MRKASPVFIAFAFICLALPAWSTTYYISANGSDSNNGTSTSTPWLHAPGMTACSGSCAAHTPSPGDRFIFRGGDIWHFGNTAATPFDGNTACLGPPHWQSCWSWNWSGTSGNVIYIGVDQTWYSGSAWSRPVIDGDNPISTSAVGSCAHDESYTSLFSLGGYFNQLDNFEFRGLCWHGNQSNSNENICCAGYINWGHGGSSASNNTLSNLYIHGWTHMQRGCSLSGGEPTGDCDGPYGINGNNGIGQSGGDRITGLICDGSDTDKQSFGCILWDAYQLDNSVLRYAVQGFVGGNCHLWYNNLWEYINYSFDGVSHTNTFECQAEWSGQNYFYNMVLRNNSGGSLVWVCPNSADYYWNIVSYNNGSQPWDIDNTCGGSASSHLYNSTFADEGNAGALGSYSAGNLLLINTSLLGSPTKTSVITMTDAQAATAGFTSSGSYAYQPQSANCNGQSSCPIGAGTNLTGNWPSGYPTSDTGFACAYNTTNHTSNCPARSPNTRPSSGAWDVGAFEFSTSAQGPNPPSGLQASVQ